MIQNDGLGMKMMPTVMLGRCGAGKMAMLCVKVMRQQWCGDDGADDGAVQVDMSAVLKMYRHHDIRLA